jgi:hypothetical protein
MEKRLCQTNRFDALTGVADENLSRQIARRHATQGTGSVLFYPSSAGSLQLTVTLSGDA